MKSYISMSIKSVVLAAVVLTLPALASASTLYSTGFESSQGFTSGTQLETNANWTGDGQDTTGWAISTTAIGGVGPATGSQYVLASSPTANLTSRFQWTVTPVTDFTNGSVITETANVKLASPASGTINRSTVAGIAMFDSAVSEIGELDIITDPENAYGGGAGHYYIGQFFPQDDETTNPGFIYDLGTAATNLNAWFSLSISIDLVAHTITGSVNGVALDGTGAITSSDFHDADIFDARILSTTGGTSPRAGFDDYSVTQSAAVTSPEPASLAALAIGGLVARRRRSR